MTTGTEHHSWGSSADPVGLLTAKDREAWAFVSQPPKNGRFPLEPPGMATNGIDGSVRTDLFAGAHGSDGAGDAPGSDQHGRAGLTREGTGGRVPG